MPGLTGFASLTPRAGRGKPDRLVVLDGMRSALTHRDWLVADDPFCDDRVCATRVDTRLLQPDPQPYRDGDVIVWMDGELYAAGGESDPALLAAGYRDDPGFSFLGGLDGFFVAVLYDTAANKVHLISDRYGFRQLFWTAGADTLWWGTELKAALQLPGFNARVDPDAVSRFLEQGFLPGDRSWLKGVELVPEATVLTWDLETAASTRTRYWDWGGVGNTTIPGDRRELVEEWGRLFVESVEKRCRRGRVGVLLSGGLDSRALLAAVPGAVTPLHAVTFGRRDSADVRLAERAARVRGAVHHVQELTEHNWLAPRFEGIWWSEGQTNLVDIHGVGGYDERREWFDINLSGFLGDVTMGGSYIRKSGAGEIDAIRTRGRRFIAMGLKMQTSYFENRIPFFDNELLEFTLSIPQSLRAREHVYADMLLSRFPDFFRNIPWQETGVPVTWPLSLATLVKRGRTAADRALHVVGVGRGHRGYGDYNAWLRREPARSLIGGILQSKDALYTEFVPRDTVVGVWEDLQRGAARGRDAGLYATLEIWLQQIFNARYRTAPTGDTTP